MVDKPDEPNSKKAKTTMTTAAKTAHFLQRSVVRDKFVKVAYFQEQGLQVFLDKLKVRSWLDLFANT